MSTAAQRALPDDVWQGLQPIHKKVWAAKALSFKQRLQFMRLKREKKRTERTARKAKRKAHNAALKAQAREENVQLKKWCVAAYIMNPVFLTEAQRDAFEIGDALTIADTISNGDFNDDALVKTIAVADATGFFFGTPNGFAHFFNRWTYMFSRLLPWNWRFRRMKTTALVLFLLLAGGFTGWAWEDCAAPRSISACSAPYVERASEGLRASWSSLVDIYDTVVDNYSNRSPTPLEGRGAVQ